MLDCVGGDSNLESIVRSYGFESRMNKRIKFESSSESSSESSDDDDSDNSPPPPPPPPPPLSLEGAVIVEDVESYNNKKTVIGDDDKTVCLSRRLRIWDKVDVVSLLSTKGRDFLIDKDGKQIKVSSIKDKYILIIKRSSLLYHDEISSALKSCIPQWLNFQLVIIFDNPRCYPDERSFKSLLSSFPSSLGVPLSDSLLYKTTLFTAIEALILDPHGFVLQLNSDIIVRYGVPSFPFTDEQGSSLYQIVHHLPTHHNPPQPMLLLENLLALRSVDSLYNPAADRSILVKQLKHKLVGLYLCCRGNSMDVIHQTSLHCQANGLDLEVVLIYLPLYNDPSSLITRINAALKDKSISSWWLLPFDDFTSRRLWNLCENLASDQFIIVGPQGQFFDTKSIRVISSHTDRAAIQHMYPYAIEAVARQETDRLKNLTLASFLSNIHLLPAARNHHPNKFYTFSDLLDKIVCLFIVNCDARNLDTALDHMNSWCLENQGSNHFDNIALVFLPINSNNSDFDFTNKSDPRMSWLYDNIAMSWLVCAPDADCETSIVQLATLRGLPHTLRTVHKITFGVDGTLISLDDYPSFPKLVACGQSDLRDHLYQLVYDTYYASYCYDEEFDIGPYY